MDAGKEGPFSFHSGGRMDDSAVQPTPRERQRLILPSCGHSHTCWTVQESTWESVFVYVSHNYPSLVLS